MKKAVILTSDDLTCSQNCEILRDSRMPYTKVVLYRDDDGRVPLVDWFGTLPEKAQDKCRLKIERLRQMSFELRRPEADLLRDGIYELRVGLQHTNYRMLYFFHGREAVVVSHGLQKQRVVPPREIDLAVRRRLAFESDPKKHTTSET